MATPGYPQMMGAGPMPMQRPVRRGTSKVVPVVVSAGLAVGVFCGLLFGLGTGKEEASAATVKKKKTGGDDDSPGAAPIGLGATAAAPAPGATPAPTAPPPAPAAAAAGSGSAVAKAEPTIKTVKLTLAIKPDAAQKSAKIIVDGKEITGNSVEVPADKKTVKVAITADGFHSVDKNIDLSGDETSVDVEMLKRGGGGTSAGSPGFGGASHVAPTIPKAPPGDKKPPKKPAGGGVIDI